MNIRVENEVNYETVIVRDIIRINQPLIGKEEIDAATDVLKSGILTEKSGMGPRLGLRKRIRALDRRQTGSCCEQRHCGTTRCFNGRRGQTGR